MARINQEQREYIKAKFFEAVFQKANDSIPKALLEKRTVVSTTVHNETRISVGGGYYGNVPRIITDRQGKSTTLPNPVLKQMEAAVAKAEKIVAKGNDIWKQIEAEMILGSDDIKKVLADALAKVAKL